MSNETFPELDFAPVCEWKPQTWPLTTLQTSVISPYHISYSFAKQWQVGKPRLLDSAQLSTCRNVRHLRRKVIEDIAQRS